MLAALRPCLVAATALLLAQPALAGGGRPAPTARPKATVVAPAKAPVAARPAILAPAAAPATPEAARPVVLAGVVLQANGQPCPGAAVYLAGAARDLVVADAQGSFRLPAGAAAKSVTVLADYFGLGSTRQVVSLPAGQPLRLTLGQSR